MGNYRIPRWLWLTSGVLAIGGVATGAILAAHTRTTDGSAPSADWQPHNPPDCYQPERHLLKRGNPAIKEVALTLDDGPHPDSLPKILDILHEYGIHATFFLVGKRIREYPGLAQQIVAGGHEVGNHTDDHTRLTDLPDDKVRAELRDCADAFRDATGEDMYVMRPPGMRFDDRVLKIVGEFNYVAVDWTNAAKDFSVELKKLNGFTTDTILSRVREKMKNGSIILLHDTKETADALPQLILGLRLEGYEIVPVSKMLADLPDPIVVPTNARTH